MKLLGIKQIVTSVLCLSVGLHVSAQDRRPNVVLILADDLGYRELGSFGQKLIRTPNLDRLARQGMRLTQHYSGNAVCAPSRCVLMTGKHPGHAYIRTNRKMTPEGQEPIPSSEITIAELLRDQGYVTGAFGKWGLGGPGSTGDPLRQGFDRFFGYNCQRHAHSYYPSYLWSDDQRVSLDNDPPVPGHASLAPGADAADPRSYDQFKGQDYAPDRINKQVLDFIRKNKERPFFLYYPTIIPHVALHVPDAELKPYLDLGWNDPPFTRSGGYGYTPHFTPRAAYAAMISRMDRYVGNVLELLDELELSENTIVIFSSDNGTTMLKQEVDYDFFNSVGELRGLKGSLYEGGVRVPTIVRWPGRVAEGSASERVSGFEDWLPTLLELTAASDVIPTNIDGISLAPTLLGRQQEARPFLYREFPSYGGQQSIRVGQWKAIRQNMTRGNLDIELYNLATDVGERNNVADQHPAVVEKLAKLMQQEHTPSKLFPLRPIDSVWSVQGVEADSGSLEIWLNGQKFATYSYRDEEIPRPYFSNIMVPGEIKVTRNHPPQPGDAQDHDTYHPGLWLAFGDISGNDYWRLKAPVRHARFVEKPVVQDRRLRFAVENLYLDQATKTAEVCREICRYDFRASGNGVLLTWDSTFRSNDHDFYFGDQEELGLGVRLATPIAVKSNSGGRILNSNGQRNENQVWGQQADWCDYGGVVDNKFVGIMLMPDSSNFRRCWYHARDYGFVAANPFGRNAFTDGEKNRVEVRKGESFRLRYGVCFHWNNSESQFKPDAVYQQFLTSR